MKIGFICPNLPGHINPMSALARHLQARGHDVVFLYSSSANGLPCIPGDKRDDLNANRPEMSKLEGNEAFEQPGIAARIAAKKTGVTMSFADLTSEHLSALLDKVLNCSIYRENAGRFQEIISKTDGLALAANIVERSFGSQPSIL
jgi:UDP:flavonoid glycosyltransferase YjiC (YdhE family)